MLSPRRALELGHELAMLLAPEVLLEISLKLVDVEARSLHAENLAMRRSQKRSKRASLTW